TPRVEAPAIAPADAPQDPDEDRAVSIVQEDRRVVVPLRPDVVVRAGFGVAKGSSHAATVAASGPHERSRAGLGTFASQPRHVPGTRRVGGSHREPGQAETGDDLSGDFGALEVLVRRAVVPLGEGRALARLPFPRRRPAARDAAVERTCLDLLLDESDR